MNILITGIAGFIGSHLGEKLVELEHNVIGIDNFDNFYSKEFKIFNLKNLNKEKKFIFYEINILDKDALKKIFEIHNLDLVVHLAAKAGVRPSILEINSFYEVNVNGTLALLETMKDYELKKMIFASSSSVYGNNQKVPFSEDDKVDLPISPYAATKKSGELLCHVFNHLYKIDITCLRFFTVFGPRQRPDLAIHKFVRLIDEGLPIPLYGDGTSSRDYTYIDDIVNGILKAIDNIEGYNIYNLGESRVISLKDLIRTIEIALDKKAIIKSLPFQSGDVFITYADISKAKKELEYKPSFSLDEGILNFVKWYKDNKPYLYK